MTRSNRRDFLRAVSAGGVLSVLGHQTLLAASSGNARARSVALASRLTQERNLLRLAPEVAPNGLILTGAQGTSDIGGGVRAPALMLNGTVPSPLLRVRQGDRFRVTMNNDLPQDLILHWHGLAPPVQMDGHPRLAVKPGSRYEYDFTVTDRAATYWYHSHSHMHTGEHTYRGIGGMILVGSAEEDAIALPSGARELPIILQDKRVDAAGVPVFSTGMGPFMMAGLMGTEAFGNGVHRPYVNVDSALYRLRLLNGSNARIFRVARSDGQPLVMIGNDGGFLPSPLTLPSLDLAPAERADILLDLRTLRAGDTLMLRSLPFTIPGSMGFMGGANLQGDPMDLVEFRVTRVVQDAAVIPRSLPAVMTPDPAAAKNTRTFRFQSQMMSHSINGRSFQMDRVDENVPFNTTELWSFVNDSQFPHPVHVHATHFRVVSRVGGRNQVMPWEAGRKDTVLVLPGETVHVAVRFTEQRGLFLLHCHNLTHEDMGMMANILVE